MMALYFGLEMRQISEIWRASIAEFDEADMGQLRGVFVDFFFEMTVALFVMSTATNMVLKAPIVSITILYSFCVPQIFHGMSIPMQGWADLPFLILIMISRLFPIYYFCCYPKNLLETHSPAVAIYATLLVAAQLAVLVLQNVLGGAFFLTERLRPVVYDYYAERPEEGSHCSICLAVITEEEPTMLTPCNHGFHEQCLKRWMQEQLICPLCRHRLPLVQKVGGD
jgi:hypothetical protein